MTAEPPRLSQSIAKDHDAMCALRRMEDAAVGGVYIESRSDGPSSEPGDPRWRVAIYWRSEVCAEVATGDDLAEVILEAEKTKR